MSASELTAEELEALEALAESGLDLPVVKAAREELAAVERGESE